MNAFGAQMKRHRNRAGVIQEAIAAATNTSISYVSLIETGKRACKRPFAAAADEICQANGQLLELWEDLYRDGTAVPAWFSDWATVEAESVALTTWQPKIIPGLLQTEAYAREVATADEAVQKRLARQELLTREQAPITLEVLMCQSALTYPVGTRETMREQLEHLAGMAKLPNISLHLVTQIGRPVGVGGAFVVAAQADRTEVAYLDTTIRGIMTDSPDDLTYLLEVLRKLRSKALPQHMTLDAIQKEIEAL